MKEARMDTKTISRTMIMALSMTALMLTIGIGRSGPVQAQMVSEEEFSALFDADPAETIKTRGLAKVPRPGFDAKKREATTYVLFETGSVLLKTPDSFQQLDAAGRAFKKALEVGKAGKWVIEIHGF